MLSGQVDMEFPADKASFESLCRAHATALQDSAKTTATQTDKQYPGSRTANQRHRRLGPERRCDLPPTTRPPKLFISILKRLLAALWLAFLVVRPISADMLLLLQGYLGDDDPWRDSGAAAALSIDGWVDGGGCTRPRAARVTGAGPRGQALLHLDLPSEAPLSCNYKCSYPK